MNGLKIFICFNPNVRKNKLQKYQINCYKKDKKKLKEKNNSNKFKPSKKLMKKEPKT